MKAEKELTKMLGRMDKFQNDMLDVYGLCSLFDMAAQLAK